MIAFPAGVKVWIAGGVTDMRRRQRFLEPVAQPLATMNTLALQVQEGLGRDPHAGEIFCFRGRKGDLVKILWHDGTGHVALSETPRGGQVHLAGQPFRRRGPDLRGAARLPSGR